MKSIDRRLAALEAETHGANVVGVWYEPQAWDARHTDGLVRVCGTDERLTQDAFAERYPGGTLIRVVYTNDWREPVD